METLYQWGKMALDYLQMVHLSDILDIVVTAYLIYKVMVMMRRSSAAQVAKAILFIVAALWLSYQMDLHVINFVLGKAMELGLLALVIVFQPEIRRFLEQVGSNRLGLFSRSRMPASPMEQAIEQTMLAYAELSRSKIGALTVFEKNTHLEEILSTGTHIDGAVSAELLKNIFYPKAPLHDGAVLVRGNGRLAGAGCVLPLSGNPNLSRDLGMRHRAGIGMSEHSDAVVAIVSEETGGISVASNGVLRRHLTPETLSQTLRTELLPPSEETEETGLWQRLRRWGRRVKTGA